MAVAGESDGVTVFLDDQGKKFYFPGEEVHGGIIVRTQRSLKIRGISVTFACRGEVKLQLFPKIDHRDRSGTTSPTSTTHHHYYDSGIREGDTTYMEQSWFVLGNGRDELSLPAGQSSYTFSLKVPEGSEFPCSYIWYKEPLRATVVYSIKADVLVTESSSQSNNWSWLVKIDVVRKVDLNVSELSHLMNPVEVALTERLRTCGSCCCCTTPPATVTLRLMKTGFRPGESILFGLEVNDVGVQHFKALAVEVNVGLGLNGKIGIGRCLSMVVSRDLDVGELQRAGGQISGHLTLPLGLYPTNLGVKGYCLINLVYFVKVFADTQKCCADPLTLTQPIFIGTN